MESLNQSESLDKNTKETQEKKEQEFEKLSTKLIELINDSESGVMFGSETNGSPIGEGTRGWNSLTYNAEEKELLQSSSDNGNTDQDVSIGRDDVTDLIFKKDSFTRELTAKKGDRFLVLGTHQSIIGDDENLYFRESRPGAHHYLGLRFDGKSSSDESFKYANELVRKANNDKEELMDIVENIALNYAPEYITSVRQLELTSLLKRIENGRDISEEGKERVARLKGLLG